MKILLKREYHKNMIPPEWCHDTECFICGSLIEIESKDLYYDRYLTGIYWNCILCNSKIEQIKQL